MNFCHWRPSHATACTVRPRDFDIVERALLAFWWGHPIRERALWLPTTARVKSIQRGGLHRQLREKESDRVNFCARLSVSRESASWMRTSSWEKSAAGAGVQAVRRVVTAPEVTASVEWHLNSEPPVAPSKAGLEVLAIVAYRLPIARSCIEHIRGSASDSGIATLLESGLIAYNPHRLFVTTRAFFEHAAMNDLANLPTLATGEQSPRHTYADR
jgi:hypothetical protein